MKLPKLPVAVFLLAFGMAYPLWAKVHPVPLDSKNPGNCAECHEDKAKGPHVHSAIATGCTSCHEIRVNKDITRVKLKAFTPVKVCLSCHSDKNAAEAKGRVHAPAIRDCIKCHEPHQSANANQLLKATSGGKAENLCLNCHTQGVKEPEKDGSRHAALDMGCQTCHITHKTGEVGKREFDFHLTKATPGLCTDCHDPNDAGIAKAHNNQPITTSECLTCHDPHESSRPKLMRRFVHQPFGEKDACATCHEPAKDGKIVLTQQDTKALCVTCHADKPEQIEKAKVQHAGAAGDCISCHDPHAGRTPGFIRPDPVNACLSCHADQAEQHKKKHLHQPAFSQGCATCHEPHGGDNKHLLRAKTINSLCLECHGPDVQPAKLEAEHLVTIFNGKVRLPENYFRRVVSLPIKYGRGHPVEKHPVVDQMDPTDVSKVRAEVNCASCHQPHASSQPGLLVKDQANNLAFCASCHKDLGK